MPARQLFRFKDRQGTVLVDMVLWVLPGRTATHPHGIKYRLYCGRNGDCLVRYDNEAGKGDHRHYGRREETYQFTTVEQLLTDFRTDCTRLAGWSWP